MTVGVCEYTLKSLSQLSQCDMKRERTVQINLGKTELLEYILIFHLPKYFHKS